MRRRHLLLVAAALAVLLAERLLAAEPADRSVAPWSIGSLVRSGDARLGVGDTATDDAKSKFLHIRISPSPRSGELKLHQFRVVDRNGETVAEVYGFHKGRWVLVFEGDWSRLEGLFLDGAGHREPLIPVRPARQAPAQSQPLARPARQPSVDVEKEVHARRPVPEPEPPVVMSRSKSSGSTPAEKLYQEVLVTQHTRCNIQGLDIDGDLQYRVLSSLSIDKRTADGVLSVTQKVERAELTRSDALTQSILGGLLSQLVGSTFEMTLDPEGRVVDFQGAKPRVRAAAGLNPLGGQSSLMASVIDPDGWREIAELTFFRPPATSGDRGWERAMKHSWGPLGSWVGRVAYVRAGQEDSLQRVRYTYHLTYQAPKADAGGLPFQVSRAEFKHGEAGGSIEFDTVKGRVVKAEERFPVQGSLTMGLLGQETPVALNETQEFRVRILEAPPTSSPSGSR